MIIFCSESMEIRTRLTWKILLILIDRLMMIQASRHMIDPTIVRLEPHRFDLPIMAEAKVNQHITSIKISGNSHPLNCVMSNEKDYLGRINPSSEFFKIGGRNKSVLLAKPLIDQANKTLWFGVGCQSEAEHAIPSFDYGSIYVLPAENDFMTSHDDVTESSIVVSTNESTIDTDTSNDFSTENGAIYSGRNVTSNVTSNTTVIAVIVTVTVATTVILIAAILAIKRRHYSKFKRSQSSRLSQKAGQSYLSDSSHPPASNGCTVTSPHEQIWPSNLPSVDNNLYNLNYAKAIPDSIVSHSKSVWEFPRQRLRVLNRLGEGCFGQVWKCQVLTPDGEVSMVVAVKTLKETSDAKERQDLLQELDLMKNLDPHPNVVQLIGCCTEKDPIYLILEYMSEGTLLAHLRQSRKSELYRNMHDCSSSLTSRDLTSYSHQIARGMLYLTQKGVVHRDLAARNVLLSSDLVCKVADFGLARDIVGINVYEKKSNGRLPIRWMAPESLYDNIFTTKTDAWSFGILLWEIVTLGSAPYPGLSAQEVVKNIKDGYRLEKPEHCDREMYNLMYYCWSEDAGMRPDFKEIVDTLESFLLNNMDYIELDKFPERLYYNKPLTSEEIL